MQQTSGQLARLALFLLVFLSCGTSSSSPANVPDPSDVATMPEKSKLSFLSLGDSYTIGESVPEFDRWSVQLAGLLREKGLDVAAPHLIARTGWTTAELLDAIKTSGNQNRYDLVSLLIGVNNQYRGQLLERYQTEFTQLLQTAIRYADNRPGRVVVLSIPDWGQSPFGTTRDQAQIARQIDAFNAAAEQICQQAGVAFVNITPLTRQAAGDDAQFAADGLHYSGKQMKQWALTALPVAERLLK